MKRTIPAVFGVVVLVAAAGCGGNGNNNKSGANPDAGTTVLPDAGTGNVGQAGVACLQIVEATARKGLECQKGPAEAVTYFTSRSSILCASADKSVAAGRVRFDASKLQACLDAIAQAPCDDLEQAPEAACDAVAAGQVAAGGQCFSEFDCAGEAECEVSDQACAAGTCVASLAVGAECTIGETCVSGATCVGGSCRAEAEENQACGPTVAECANSDYFICDAGTCKAKATSGTCELDSEACAPGYVCRAEDGADTGTCTAVVALNGTCDETLQEDECAPFTVCTAGTCKLWGKLNEPCFGVGLISTCLEGQCQGGDFMNPGTCVALPKTGEACNVSTPCQVGAECDLQQSKCVACP